MVIKERLVEGWKKIEGAMTAPKGYSWYSNGASRFSGEHRCALVKDKQEDKNG